MRWCLLVFLLGIAMLMACSSDQMASDDLPLQATAFPAVAAEAHTPETEVVLPLCRAQYRCADSSRSDLRQPNGRLNGISRSYRRSYGP